MRSTEQTYAVRTRDKRRTLTPTQWRVNAVEQASGFFGQPLTSWRAHRTVKSFEIRLCRHVRVVATRRRSLDSRRQMTKLLYGSPQRPPYRQNRVRTINLTSIIFRHPLPATTFSGFLHVRFFSGQYYTQYYIICKVLKYAEVASRNCLLLFTKVIERADCTVIQNVDHLIIHSIL